MTDPTNPNPPMAIISARSLAAPAAAPSVSEKPEPDWFSRYRDWIAGKNVDPTIGFEMEPPPNDPLAEAASGVDGDQGGAEVSGHRFKRDSDGTIIGVEGPMSYMTSERCASVARLAAEEERTAIAKAQRADALHIRNDLAAKMLTIPLDAQVSRREALQLLNDGIAGALEDWATEIERGDHWHRTATKGEER